MIRSSDAIRTVPPATLPVTLSEFKAQTRISHSEEDAIMMAHLRAATELCENYTSMGFITQTWTETYETFPTTIEKFLVLSRRPVQSIVSIDYLDSAGTTAVLDPSMYRLIGIGWDKRPASIWQPSSGAAWPAILGIGPAVTVTYVVGFGGEQNLVPELIRHAVLMAAASLYAFREDFVTGPSPTEIPFSSMALLRDWHLEPVV